MLAHKGCAPCRVTFDPLGFIHGTKALASVPRRGYFSVNVAECELSNLASVAWEVAAWEARREHERSTITCHFTTARPAASSSAATRVLPARVIRHSDSNRETSVACMGVFRGVS